MRIFTRKGSLRPLRPVSGKVRHGACVSVLLVTGCVEGVIGDRLENAPRRAPPLNLPEPSPTGSPEGLAPESPGGQPRSEGGVPAAGHTLGSAECETVPAAMLSNLEHPVGRWVQVTTPQETPQFRWEAGGAYDAKTGTWFHQGGHDYHPQSQALFVYDFAQGSWAQRFPPNSPGGACNIDGAVTFDTVNRQLVRFPSDSLGHGYQYSRSFFLKYSWVWLYDADRQRWRNMRPPPYALPRPRSSGIWTSGNSSVTFDSRRGLVYHFGGREVGDHWFHVYDAHDNGLRAIQTTARPAKRDGAGIAYSALNDVVVLYGAQWTLEDPITWTYRPGADAWIPRELHPTPPYQIASPAAQGLASIPRIACDDRGPSCLAVVWQDGRHETWLLDTNQWHWQRVGTNDDALPDSLSRSRNLHFLSDRRIYALELFDGVKSSSLWTFRPPSDRVSMIPAVPTSLTVVTTERRSAVLTWRKSPAAVSYRVYRGTGQDRLTTDLVPITETDCPHFEDAQIEPATLYFYGIQSIAPDGAQSAIGAPGRTQPQVPEIPTVVVDDTERVTVTWDAHQAPDVVGYNLYRGSAQVRAVTHGEPRPWRDNDPKYAERAVTQVEDITDWQRINRELLTQTAYEDRSVDLSRPGAHAGGYRYAVYAYVVRAVNQLGVESGPSPYELTLPAPPRNLMLRELDEHTAELRWDPATDPSVVGYQIIRMDPTIGAHGFRIDTEMTNETQVVRRVEGNGPDRFWVTAIDKLGQLGAPSSPAWFKHRHRGYYDGLWHQ